MGLPEEDKGPAWLRGWGNKTGYTDLDTFTGYVDSNALSVDINSLVAFANALQTEHEQDYRPHVKQVFDEMSAQAPGPDARFIELTDTLTHHRDMLVQTSTALMNHDTAIMAFVEAARAISAEYGNTDAMNAATVSDIDTQLAVPTTTGGDGGNGGNGGDGGDTETVTPEEAAAQTDDPPATTGTDPNTGAPVTSDNGRDV